MSNELDINFCSARAPKGQNPVPNSTHLVCQLSTQCGAIPHDWKAFFFQSIAKSAFTANTDGLVIFGTVISLRRADTMIELLKL
ncbi:hypothetical protein [Nafulsella turpanensis]|uniref:hypothetical protein n=1 Tax=Nafulsella turpanensis TaxID=1265690 RepID=UPI001268D551|nr:hypothetical protein [Nafulsella turpanensis]